MYTCKRLTGKIIYFAQAFIVFILIRSWNCMMWCIQWNSLHFSLVQEMFLSMQKAKVYLSLSSDSKQNRKSSPSAGSWGIADIRYCRRNRLPFCGVQNVHADAGDNKVVGCSKMATVILRLCLQGPTSSQSLWKFLRSFPFHFSLKRVVWTGYHWTS